MSSQAPRRRAVATTIALHGVALAILLWPLVGVEFVPMVDLPGHLAITRVLDDFLHGKYRALLHLNVDPLYKPTYAVLYAVFAVVPKSMVGPVTVGLMIASCYAAVAWGIATLGRRSASSPLVVSLATVVGMFCFSSAFFWGLIPFLWSVPPALIAYAAYLRASGIVDGPSSEPQATRTAAIVFLVAAVAAHVVHPLSSFFLGMMLAVAAVVALALRNRFRTVAWPLVVWAAAVVALDLLGAHERHEVDLERSLAGVAAPFHGVTAARAFLAQIPIELGLLPTRNRAATLVRYPTAVAFFLAAATTMALVGSRVARSADRRAVVRLAGVFVPSALLFLFVRHDVVRVSMGAVWFPVRGTAFVVFFFAVLAAAALTRAVATSRFARPLSAAVAVGGLALALERSAVLRVHFLDFDRNVRGFFAGQVTERYFRIQPVTYGDHIRVYNCYFGDVCRDQSRLFYMIYPETTIYPLSVNQPPTP